MYSRTGELFGVSNITILWYNSNENLQVTQNRTYDRKPAVRSSPERISIIRAEVRMSRSSSIGFHYLNAPPNEAPLSVRIDPEFNSSMHKLAFQVPIRRAWASWRFPRIKTTDIVGEYSITGLKRSSALARASSLPTCLSNVEAV
jgi:hypothetical protein